jgi:hypothetical protein
MGVKHDRARAVATLAERERRALEPLLALPLESHSVEERIMLRCVYHALTSERIAGNLFDDVRRVLWTAPFQVGIEVDDARRLEALLRAATREDGAPVFRADPWWVLATGKRGVEWSLRERDAARYGLQIYRRGRTRDCDGEIVIDVDAVSLAAGILRHVADVVRPRPADSASMWEALAARW